MTWRQHPALAALTEAYRASSPFADRRTGFRLWHRPAAGGLPERFVLYGPAVFPPACRDSEAAAIGAGRAWVAGLEDEYAALRLPRRDAPFMQAAE